MKIVQISSEINSGSVGRIAEQIGEKALDHGWSSFIAFARDNQPSKSKTIRIGSNLDIIKHGMLTRLTDKHGYGSKRATRRLIAKIKELKPDIIHLHHLHGYFINIEVLFHYLASINTPIIWTFHDCWSFTGHCAYFDYVGCNKWINGCYNCEQKKEYPASFIMDRSKKNYIQKKELFNSVENMTIVPVSYWLGNLVQQSFLKKHQIKVIQNGIDIDLFRPSDNSSEFKKKYKLENKFLILGVASTWDRRKGLEEFLKLDKLLNEDEKIILVGVSSKQKNKLPPSIIGIERTENVKQLADLYSTADVFVNPTFEDTFPTTNLEALACGTPVITYRTGGSVESVCKETGFIVNKGNIEELLLAVRKIKKVGKQAYSNKCREKAINNYNKTDRFNDYITLYKQILSENSI